jgi:DNA mismatch endonuclease (patch repair protein)
MADTLSPQQRSERMARIRGRDTAPELVLRRALHRQGFRYRLYGAQLPGKPDIVLPRHRSVVFVNGCFWHRHEGCRVATTPKSNTEFWRAKFDRNVDRDARVAAANASLGWRVFVVWECELSPRKAGPTVEALAKAIRAQTAEPAPAIQPLRIPDR